jgi:hypothetical protein
MGLSKLIETVNTIFPSGGSDPAPHESGITLKVHGPQQSGVSPIASGSIVYDGDESMIVDDDET